MHFAYQPPMVGHLIISMEANPSVAVFFGGGSEVNVALAHTHTHRLWKAVNMCASVKDSSLRATVTTRNDMTYSSNLGCYTLQT